MTSANWTKWTPALVDDLKRRWNAGESAGDIGKALKLTRNAVIGKVTRLRQAGDIFVERHDDRVSETLKPRRPGRQLGVPQPKKPAAVGTGKVKPPTPKPGVLPPDIQVRVDQKTEQGAKLLESVAMAMPGTGISLMETSQRTCMFPTGGAGPDWLFCGARTDPKTRYCTGHHRIVYEPSRPRNLS